MEVLCVCREILLMLGEQASGLELNDQMWPRLQNQGVSWAKMKEVLDRMTSAGLVTVRERLVPGNRRATFYRLAEAGWKEFRSLNSPLGEKGNANATSFCGEKDCCFNKKAA